MRCALSLAITFALFLQYPLLAQENGDRLFRQLDDELPTPTSTRTGSGAPGHEYWQQRADYSIDVTLNEEEHRILGRETITYSNNSPDTLRYLWVQLDQNYYAKDSQAFRMRSTETCFGSLLSAVQFSIGSMKMPLLPRALMTRARCSSRSANVEDTKALYVIS